MRAMAAWALITALLTAVLAKPSRVVASALVGPFIEGSSKYALTASRRTGSGLAAHAAPSFSPALTTKSFCLGY
jgi:hypothetical protein